MNFTKINELKPQDLNCNVFDVYSYDGLSMQELLCQFFTKINECVKTSNDTIDLASWLVNEGLKQEVAQELVTCLNDGTFENLINVTLFENLNNKIDNVSSQLEQKPNKSHVWNMNNMGQDIKEALTGGSVAVVGKNTILKDNIVDKQITIEKTNFIKPKKNMFNYKERLIGYYIHNDGSLLEFPGFSCSNFIYVYPGTYTVSNARWVAFYDNSQNLLERRDLGYDYESVTHYTFNETGYIRCAGFDGADSRYDLAKAQVENGGEKTGFEPFKALLNDEIKITNSNLIDDEKNKLGKITVYKEGDSIRITSKFNDWYNISINSVIDNTRNNCFNFVSTELHNDTNSEVIHSNFDDIAPINTFYLVGGNHGYPTFECSSSGQSQSDVGSIWTDGVNDFVLLKVENNKVIFAKPYTEEENGVIGYKNVTPKYNLTNKNTGIVNNSINISSLEESQLYPSVNKHKIKLYLDGEEINSDGYYIGDKLQVSESYNIMCYKEIQEYLKNNIGSNVNNDNIKGVVNLSINYTFTEGCNCYISHSIKALKNVVLGQSWFIQSISLAPKNNETLYRYIPGVKPKEGVNFSNFVDMTNYNQTIIFNKNDLINNNPCARYIDIIKNQDGSIKCGFTMGYIEDKTNSKNTDRLKNCDNLLNIYYTKKVYPIAIENITLNKNDYMSFSAYRNYFSPNELIFKTTVSDSKDTYFMLDGENITSNINLNNHIGKNISVVNSNNFVLNNDTVDCNGIDFTMNNQSFATLKIN